MKKVQGITFSLLLLLTISMGVNAQSPAKEPIDFNTLSEELVKKVLEGEDTQDLREILALTKVQSLEQALDTNEKRLAFWVNIYNAYIQYFLRDNPALYKDRSAFFKKDQIRIAGEVVSFSKIEHGIIRKSQWEYGLGNVGKLFPDDFERTLRVEEPDYRIHFALNCGAKDCPPVAVYQWQRLNEQFRKGTERYLKRTTTYDTTSKTAKVTTLFSWFRGDFGGKDGTKEILRKLGLIPNTTDVELEYKDYDWTLYLDNFIVL
jgi:hypothetical protein